jgi:hypothetical protein
MNKEILDIIEKNLPTLQMAALRTELQKAASFEPMQKTIQEKDEIIKKFADRIVELEILERKEKELENKKIDLELRERNLTIKILEIKLEMTNQNNNNMKDLVNAVFRSPFKTTSISSSNNSSSGYLNESKTITETES